MCSTRFMCLLRSSSSGFLVFLFSCRYSVNVLSGFPLVHTLRAEAVSLSVDNSDQISHWTKAMGFLSRTNSFLLAVVTGNYRFCKCTHTHTQAREKVKSAEKKRYIERDECVWGLLNMEHQQFQWHTTVELHLIMDTCYTIDSHTCSNTLITRGQQKNNHKNATNQNTKIKLVDIRKKDTH